MGPFGAFIFILAILFSTLFFKTRKARRLRKNRKHRYNTYGNSTYEHKSVIDYNLINTMQTFKDVHGFSNDNNNKWD